jgi:hypothetical protein
MNILALVVGLTFPIFGLFQGVVLVLGARRLRNLQGYRFVALSSVVAMIPWSPFVVIGLPVGLWTLVVLSDPEVKAAFQRAAAAGTPVNPRG